MNRWPDLFPQNDIPIIIQDVQNACQSLTRPPVGTKRPEENLSRQVYKKLRFMERYRQGPLEPRLESVLPDLDGRADILFSCGKGIDTYFIFEAKRLFVTFPKARNVVPLVKEYVNDGMMRFVSEKYAPFQQASAMLGYVHDANILTARNAVGVEINKHGGKLCLQGRLDPAGLPVMPPVDQTIHELNDRRLFTLYHLFAGVPR